MADLVLRYLPQYDFSSSELDMFPRDLRNTEDVEGMGSTEENQNEDYKALFLLGKYKKLIIAD